MPDAATLTAPAVQRPTGDTSARHWTNWLFWACTIAGLLPLLLWTTLPTVDGPAHVYNAQLLLDYWGDPNHLAHRYYVPNEIVPPNWFGHAALAALLTVCGPFTAEKLLIAGYVLLLPLAFRYVLRSVAPDPQGVEFLAFPLIYNSHLHWGFYNFCYSLAFFLLLFGWWLRRRQNMQLHTAAGLAAGAVLLYLCHIVALAELGIAIALFSLADLLCGRLTWRERATLRTLAYTGLAFVPSVLLYLQYALGRANRAQGVTEWPSARYAASLLFKLAPLRSFTDQETGVTTALALIVLAAVFWAAVRQRASATVKTCWVWAAVTALLVFALPAAASGGTMITPRLVYFPLFALAVALACHAWPGQWRTAWIVAGIGTGLALHALHLPLYQRYEPQLQSLLRAASALPAGGTLAFRTLEPSFPFEQDPRTGRPYLSGNSGAYLAVQNHMVYLSNYEAETDHFPFRYRPVPREPEWVLLWGGAQTPAADDGCLPQRSPTGAWRVYHCAARPEAVAGSIGY